MLQHDHLQLRHGAWQVDLQPSRGGSCSALRWQPPGQAAPLELLRPQSAASDEVLHSACFALLPYSNRLFDARLIAPDGVFGLPRNLARMPVPVHGLGWRTPWRVIGQGADHVQLGYDHAGDPHWPFAHGAVQAIRLDGDAVEFELRVRNRDRRAMPLGMGWHPCFAIDADTTVRWRSGYGWLPDDAGRPQRQLAAEADPRFDFREPRRADGVVLNHCLGAWSGSVDIVHPARGVSLQMTAHDSLRHLVVYRRAGQPWLCIEPVSHASGAFSIDSLHAAAHGVRALAPGLDAHAWMRLQVNPSPN